MAAPRDDAHSSLILLDACCVLNLYGGRCIHQLLRTSGLRFAVAERAAGEALYVRNVTADGTEELESVDLHPLIADGLLRVLTIDSEVEAAAYVRFATQLDDGEAMACALAAERGAAVATDDREAPATASVAGASRADVQHRLADPAVGAGARARRVGAEGGAE
jgi:hypothetical protein